MGGWEWGWGRVFLFRTIDVEVAQVDRFDAVEGTKIRQGLLAVSWSQR